MGQPVKLSDKVVLEARLAAEEQERSIAGQVEHWIALGKALEGPIRVSDVARLKRYGTAVPVSKALASVDSPAGRKRLEEHLHKRPYPHFEAAPARRGLLVRIDEDGTRTVGRFVNREFRPAK